jgi:hypothetical protein
MSLVFKMGLSSYLVERNETGPTYCLVSETGLHGLEMMFSTLLLKVPTCMSTIAHTFFHFSPLLHQLHQATT